jgi:hypothetical protein
MLCRLENHEAWEYLIGIQTCDLLLTTDFVSRIFRADEYSATYARNAGLQGTCPLLVSDFSQN